MSSDQDSYNKGGMVALVISMVVTFAMMFYVTFFGQGIDLKEVAKKAEAAAPAQTQAGAAAVDISQEKEPWMPSEKMVGAGKQLYMANCTPCHGASGQGDGPAAASMNPKPRNFVEGKWKKGGTRLGLFEVLETGLPPSSMQSYKHLPKNDRWALVHYIRSITQNKIEDKDADVAAKAPSLQ